ncbi:unnamed protein product [Ilex paraguariensis]|uniref:Uncharacterized protein n=1 Tax=Ilex paraguariensis TaxID=185542 RepID=A0ABC8RI84_9AQUA
MEFPNGEQSRELLQAQAHIWNQIFNFINSMSLKCAIQLGIPDVIHSHGRPMTLFELVDALPIHHTKAQFIYRLMCILIHSGFFITQKISENDEGGYLLTLASRLLLKDEPFSVTPFLLAMLDPILTNPWHHVSDWFQNDDPTPFYTTHGRTVWEYAAHEPKLNHFFNDAMSSDAQLVANVVVRDCKGVFEGFNSLMDVGGGTGTVAKAIANEFPHLKCIVLDLPHVVADLEGTENLSYVGGDMFEAIPPTDVVLLKSDEESLRILKKCREAIPGKDKGGKVIIIDMIVQNHKGDDESIETELFFDMLVMILVTGRQRNNKEWAKLFFDAGFSDYKKTPLGLRSVIEVYP